MIYDAAVIWCLSLRSSNI